MAAADDVGGRRPAAVGGRESDEPPLEAVEVRIPERGRWVLAVRLALADGRGEATWYWLLRAG